MSAGNGVLRILIVDDHVLVREGLLRVLGGAPEAWQVAEAGDGLQALDRLRHEAFDLVITDLSMPGISGLEFIHRVRAEFGRLPLLVLSMHAEEQYALRAFKAGANGYVTKDSAAVELIKAVRKVAAGGAYVSPGQAERVVLRLNGSVAGARHEQLSDRELDVLCRLVSGQRPTEIAEALHLSVKTVSTHKSRIQEKLQLATLAELVRYGLEHGLVGDAPAVASNTCAG